VLAAENPRVVTLSGETDLRAFDLPDGEWPVVFLFAEHRGEGTVWLQALRSFARTHPTSRVHLFLWKATGYLGEDRSSVIASTIIAAWRNGKKGRKR